MPESGASTLEDAEVAGGLTRPDAVGRDGIEPPTLRFSVAGLGVQQRASLVTVLVSLHVAKQAYALFGRVLIDRDVDRRGLTSGQGLGASGAESGGSPLWRARDTAWLAVDVLDDRLTELFLGRRSWRLVKAQRITSLADSVDPSSRAWAASRVSLCRCPR
jgi:hypothetical protein